MGIGGFVRRDHARTATGNAGSLECLQLSSRSSSPACAAQPHVPWRRRLLSTSTCTSVCSFFALLARLPARRRREPAAVSLPAAGCAEINAESSARRARWAGVSETRGEVARARSWVIW